MKNDTFKENGVLEVPKNFSIIENSKNSFLFIQSVTASLINQNYRHIKLDYNKCQKVDLGTQVFLDIIIKEILEFFKKCDNHKKIRSRVESIGGININNENVSKLLFSVGSIAIHMNKAIKFNDIIPYKLCIYDREYENPIKNMEQKDIDTTKLVDYVLDSLQTLKKKLTPEKLDDLCTVIGEVLINAEEHSTTKCRFSIGYFYEISDNGKHYGVFRLAILNFGKTIYEKFTDPQCPNIKIVEQMKILSEKYTTRKMFLLKKFEEETLWTLYALQEGVTSVSTESYKKRGNGSIQFIESFFKIKGCNNSDKISKMAILSGNTSIIFNGSYKITEK